MSLSRAIEVNPRAIGTVILAIVGTGFTLPESAALIAWITGVLGAVGMGLGLAYAAFWSNKSKADAQYYREQEAARQGSQKEEIFALQLQIKALQESVARCEADRHDEKIGRIRVQELYERLGERHERTVREYEEFRDSLSKDPTRSITKDAAAGVTLAQQAAEAATEPPPSPPEPLPDDHSL